MEVIYMRKIFLLGLLLCIYNISFGQNGVDFINLQWRNDLAEIEEAHIDDIVIIKFETNNISNDVIINIEMWSKTDNGVTDLIDNIQGIVINGIVEVEWQVIFDYEKNINATLEIHNNRYTIIDYYFVIKYENIAVTSKYLPIYSYFDHLIIDDMTEEPIRNRDFILLSPDGRFLMGTTNDEGRAIMKNLRRIGSYNFIM
jgi:hypothetical protein